MPPAALIWSKTILPALSAPVPNLAAPPDMKSTIATFSSAGLLPLVPGPPGLQALARRVAGRIKPRALLSLLVPFKAASIHLARDAPFYAPRRRLAICFAQRRVRLVGSGVGVGATGLGG